jgi:AraC family transcriptional regulator, transcriptional activator of the genes for pyochelin and ferripyochelin receptors
MSGLHITEDEIQRFQAIKEKIDNEFRESISYGMLAKSFQLNEFKLRHGFVHCFGETIHGYQEQLRICYACELLQSKQSLSIYEIAYEAGYNERSTFYRAFTRLREMVLGEWKKLNNNKQKDTA